MEFISSFTKFFCKVISATKFFCKKNLSVSGNHAAPIGAVHVLKNREDDDVKDGGDGGVVSEKLCNMEITGHNLSFL